MNGKRKERRDARVPSTTRDAAAANATTAEHDGDDIDGLDGSEWYSG